MQPEQQKEINNLETMETNIKKAGRPTGSKNVSTQEVRERFRELVECNLSKFQDDLDSLEPKDRLQIVLQLAKFVLPTLKATTLKTDSDKVITIDFGEYRIPDIGNRLKN